MDKPSYKDGKVFISRDQYFGNVPEAAWNFYIGGYQPARKWLKSRISRNFSKSEFEHYQKIIVSLMKLKNHEKIDSVLKI